SSASGVGHGPCAGDPQPRTSDRGFVFTCLRTPPKLPHALTSLAEAGGFNYLMSLSPVQMLAPPHQELTETEVPYLDMDSVGEMPTGPDQFAVPHPDLNNKQTQYQKFPEAVPESIPRDFFGIPDKTMEPAEEAETSPSQQEAQPRHPELNEEAKTLPQQEPPAQHPQSPE
ncbi:hypothetical protein EI555_008821, partial [Monodon monoceros]